MSRFLNESSDPGAADTAGIDFSVAAKLPGGGSTCDIYRIRRQRREVLVKRLKPRFRSIPLYLDALDKEFEIGAGLHHPGLPEYREFHREYIVLDYIDGKTLQQMISDGDPWLADPANALRMMRKLADAVAYLHFHGIVHCDIKPDNVILTADTRNPVLIDFDKAYSASLSDTPGDPAQFGLPEDLAGKTATDIIALSLIAERLRSAFPGLRSDRKLARFIKDCREPGMTAASLAENSEREKSTSPSIYILPALAVTVIFLAALCLRHLFPDRSEGDIDVKGYAAVAMTDTTGGDTPDESRIASPPVHELQAKEREDSHIRSQAELHAEAAAKADLFDRRVQPLYDELIPQLDHLSRLGADSSLTSGELLSAIRAYVDREDECIQESYAILNETFPGLSQREAGRIMAYSKAYTGYKRKSCPILNEIGHEIENRRNSR